MVSTLPHHSTANIILYLYAMHTLCTYFAQIAHSTILLLGTMTSQYYLLLYAVMLCALVARIHGIYQEPLCEIFKELNCDEDCRESNNNLYPSISKVHPHPFSGQYNVGRRGIFSVYSQLLL